MKKDPIPSAAILNKSSTGIEGLDEITGGGLPAGRATLICGAAGCGKTMLAIEFLVRGATQFNRARRFYDVRGKRIRALRERELDGLRPRSASDRKEDRARLCPYRT